MLKLFVPMYINNILAFAVFTYSIQFEVLTYSTGEQFLTM